MKVKDLINQLSKYNPNSDVLCYTEEEGLVAKKHIFRILHIEDVSKVNATKCRSNDHLPSLKFEESNLSEEHVLLNVVGDF